MQGAKNLSAHLLLQWEGPSIPLVRAAIYHLPSSWSEGRVQFLFFCPFLRVECKAQFLLPCGHISAKHYQIGEVASSPPCKLLGNSFGSESGGIPTFGKVQKLL